MQIERALNEAASSANRVLDELIPMVDGAEGREGVIVVGATNLPDKIDPAILRPGRLERTIAIPLPDTPARAGILRFHLGEHLPDTDLISLSQRLEGLSGADLEKIVDLEVAKLVDRVKQKNIKLVLDAKARDFLIEKGYDPAYGARPMRRAVEKYLEDPLAEELLKGAVKAGTVAHVTATKDALITPEGLPAEGEALDDYSDAIAQCVVGTTTSQPGATTSAPGDEATTTTTSEG